MAVKIADTLEFLLGRWAIERTIDDRREAGVLHFTGVAVVERTDDGAVYTETGEVRTVSHSGPARRTLRLTDLGDGTVRVDFQDGRPFLDLDLSAGRDAATHPCRADTYEMGFEVLAPDALAETWHVTGPAKDYSAETNWRRLS